VPSGRELCHSQFSLQVASPETFRYTLVVYQHQYLFYTYQKSKTFKTQLFQTF